MKTPWVAVDPIGDKEFVRLRRRAIFDCYKWDPQFGDVCVIARHPLVITHESWREVSTLATALAIETRAAEQELSQRIELHRILGLPRAVRRLLRQRTSSTDARGVARIMRFDFHFTTQGWRVSEVNSDVPGGLNEASGLSTLIADHYPTLSCVGDPIAAYVDALGKSLGRRGTVALLHATAYSDDQQMMAAIAQRLLAHGIAIQLASPAHLRWHNCRAELHADWWRGDVDLVVRFFPAEWLPALPDACGARHFFVDSETPLSNPATAIVTQTKRFPLVWDALRTPLPTWRRLMPETRDPRDAPRISSSDWILKPALGRAGEGIGIREAIEVKEFHRITRLARWWPRAWVAQRRFDPVPIEVYGERVFPCLGVYTLDAQVIGAYGRVAARPLIDARAADAAVLAA